MEVDSSRLVKMASIGVYTCLARTDCVLYELIEVSHTHVIGGLVLEYA